ncbi:MAG: hypothetical protein Q7K28_02885 [Candidatus Wildermuthbacteria bacterium]|nr:hypothetical protein [Candidatus Wildermuthbacteria bacterium]
MPEKEKERNQKKIDDCPLCHISDETLEILKEKGEEKAKRDKPSS